MWEDLEKRRRQNKGINSRAKLCGEQRVKEESKRDDEMCLFAEAEHALKKERGWRNQTHEGEKMTGHGDALA